MEAVKQKKGGDGMNALLTLLMAALMMVCAANVQPAVTGTAEEDGLREHIYWAERENYGSAPDEPAEEMTVPVPVESVHGYTVWVDEAWFVRGSFAGTEHDYFYAAGSDPDAPDASVLIVPADVAWEDVRDFLAEAVAMYPPESLSVEEQYDIPVRDGSVRLEYFTRAAEEDGTVYRFYAVKAPQGLLCVTATYPETDVCGYAEEIDRMIQSIEFAE